MTTAFSRRTASVLTAAVTTFALMTASTAPAFADRASDNLAKALVAALAIGAIVNSVDKGHARPAPVRQPPREIRSPRVPEVCAIEISGSRRDVTVYPERCLRREGFDARLPRHCAHEARVFGRTDRVYGEDCLRDAGLRVGDRSYRRDAFDGDQGRHDRRRLDRDN